MGMHHVERGVVVGQRHAIRHAKLDVGKARGRGIGARPFAPDAAFGDDDCIGVKLVEGEELRRLDTERRGSPGAVEGHRVGLVPGARSAVEAGVDARGGAAAARE